ncbi:MAG TPA: hypothetical protein VIZ43_08535 [Trebonia sp.]
MSDRHDTAPISYRPPVGDLRAWLKERAETTGAKVNAVITQAVTEHRERIEHHGAELELSGSDAQAILRHAVASMTELQRKAKDDAVFLPSARSAADLACRLRRMMLDNPGCGFTLRASGTGTEGEEE